MRRRSAAPWLVAALIGIATASVAADRDADLERLRDAIEERRERVARYESEERGLLATLEAIERTAEILEREVVHTRRHAEQTRLELARAEREAAGLAERVVRTERAMSRRAVALYKAGELGAMPVLFAAADLRDFLSRIESLRRLLGHDADLLARHRAESRALEKSRERAARAAEESQGAQRAAAERAQQLEAEREQKRAIVRRLRGSRARERAALAEFETAARALEETVAAFPAARASVPTLPRGPAFESLRGQLAAPVDAPIARDFGRVVDERFRTETFRKGVEFEAPRGTPVRAVAPGRVRYAGRFRGYGNLVILDHGDQYFTVYAHLSQIDVEVGQGAAAGEGIGLLGDSGSLSGPSLYFEVRRGGTPLDPREWLGSLGTPARKR
jgi:septal ring factor EnvC (AmiA/AmiB activator)